MEFGDKNNLIENEHIVYVKPMNDYLLREKNQRNFT